jgi:dihydrofolate reductase
VVKLVYSAIASMDGYTTDEDGNFDLLAPDAEVHAFINDLERGFGTCLYGRRMYEMLVYRESPEADDDKSPIALDFAGLWMAADKVVYSRTLEGVSSAKTRLERSFDPEAVRRMKEQADRDLSIGGSELAGQALEAGLVDDIHLFLMPVMFGGGKAVLPDHVPATVELLGVDRFEHGVVHLHYGIAT